MGYHYEHFEPAAMKFGERWVLYWAKRRFTVRLRLVQDLYSQIQYDSDSYCQMLSTEQVSFTVRTVRCWATKQMYKNRGEIKCVVAISCHDSWTIGLWRWGRESGAARRDWRAGGEGSKESPKIISELPRTLSLTEKLAFEDWGFHCLVSLYRDKISTFLNYSS